MSGTRMDIEVRELRLKHSWTISRGSADVKHNVFVRLERYGIVGEGEAAPNTRYDETADSTVAMMESARSLIEGADFWHFEPLGRAIAALGKGQTAAKAALDMAVLDWVGKAAGLPLYRLWGLDPAAAPRTTYSIGIDSLDKVREKVRESAIYPLLKIKVGRDDTRAIMEAVRAETDRVVRIDANEAWTDREEALREITWLAGHNVEFVEQPMPAARADDIAWLRERSPLPLIADESVKSAADIPSLAGVFDGINIKVMKSAGLQEARRMVAMARAVGLKVMLGCMVESALAITAAAHLAPAVDYADLDGNLLLADDPYVGATVEDGYLRLPDGPGIGAAPRG